MKRTFLVFLLIAAMLMMSVCSVTAEETTWSDYVAVVDGVEYPLPVPMTQFADNGWVCEDNDVILEPNQYTLTWLNKGGEVICVSAINLGINDAPVSECMAGGVEMSSYEAEKGASLSIAGFTLGDAKDDLMAAWGDPTMNYDGSTRSSITYETDSYENVEVGFDPESGVILDLKSRCMTAPEGYNDEAYAAEVEVPESVTAYVAPAELGDDPLSFTFKLNDVVYQLPVPVSVMAENGWKLNGTEYAPRLSAHEKDSGWKLQNGAQALDSVSVYNDSPKANTWENGMVIEYRVYASSPVNIELPGGITLETKMADLEALWEGLPYEKDESGSLTFYDLAQENSYFRSISITFDTEKDSVYSIEVECWPD